MRITADQRNDPTPPAFVAQALPGIKKTIQACAAKIISAAFSPIMMQAALVLPETSVGMIEPSAMRSPSRPCTYNCASTNAIASLPILQVQVG